jgi:transposase-like protein
MKSQKVKNKALELYIGNVPIYKISKQLKINKDTFYKWSKKGSWDKLKEEASQKAAINTTNELINLQTELGRLASEELLCKVKDKVLGDKELVSLAKHSLEVVRPKSTTNNLNIKSDKVEHLKIIIEEKKPDGATKGSD